MIAPGQTVTDRIELVDVPSNASVAVGANKLYLDGVELVGQSSVVALIDATNHVYSLIATPSGLTNGSVFIIELIFLVDGARVPYRKSIRVDETVASRSSHAAPDLSNLDVAVSSRAVPGDVQVTVQPADITINPTELSQASIDTIVGSVWSFTSGSGRTLSSFDFNTGNGIGDHLLTVTVTSAGGAVSGATITLQTSAGVRHAAGQTDANGQATFGVSDDTYTLIVKATGYDSTTDTVEVDGANATKAITLTASATADPAPAGFTNVPYLATNADGQPLAGVEITAAITRTAHDDVGHAYAKTQTRTTDAAGAVTLILPHNSTADVSAGDVRESVTVQEQTSTAVQSIVIAT